jgi:hypothetical protein
MGKKGSSVLNFTETRNFFYETSNYGSRISFLYTAMARRQERRLLRVGCTFDSSVL